MKTKMFFALAASLFMAGVVGAVERVAYVERTVPKCVTSADGVTRCTMVTETVVTTVSDGPILAVAGQTTALSMATADSCPTCPQTASSAFYQATVSVRSGAAFPRLTGIRSRIAEWRANRVRLLGLFGAGCP